MNDRQEIAAEPVGLESNDSLNSRVGSMWFLRVWSVFGLFLFATTWRLWTPQSLYPQVPVFESMVNAPGFIDWVAFVLIVASLIWIAITPKVSGAWSRWPIVVFASSLLVSFLLDQHRLQPWAWHWFVFAGVLVMARRGDAMRWFRWIVVSIYIYSAISKLDYQFTHSVGLQIVQAMAGLAGVSLAEHSPDLLSRFVLLLPLTELVIGIGLAFVATRRLCGWLAILLHVGLLLALGPLGLNHQSPVLIWNAFFIFQAYWLFVQREQREYAVQINLMRGWPAAAFALAVILFPITCSFGGCDHWLAWELYAPRSSRVKIELPGTAVEQLPYPARNYTMKSPKLPGVVELDLSEWSLSELGVPVYPQSRFQLGVARAVRNQMSNDRLLRVTIKSRSDRRTGQRVNELLRGNREFEEQASKFWLNSTPRTASPADEHPLAQWCAAKMSQCVAGRFPGRLSPRRLSKVGGFIICNGVQCQFRLDRFWLGRKDNFSWQSLPRN